MKAIVHLPGRLAAKINAILLLFFVVALAIILATLYVGRHLQGGAAAINEAGAERMRTYRIAYLLERGVTDDQARTALHAEARGVIDALESTLTLLEEGDAERPLFLPRDARVRDGMAALRMQWQQRLRPLALDAIQAGDPGERSAAARRFGEAAREFAPAINELVLLIETSNARRTEQMWLLQNALVGFALAGTILLSYLFAVLVIKPVVALKRGMEQMAAADFGVRLQAGSQDELGELAAGFNDMADRLKDLYDTLEQRVATKTRDLEAKNRELAVLYEIAAYLADPGEIPAVCRGVLERVRVLLGADAGAVRLIDAHARRLDLVAGSNLPERFMQAEARLALGEGLCGQAAELGQCVARVIDGEEALPHCAEAGLRSVAAVPIRSKSEVFGLLNLFFRQPRTLVEAETLFLEAVGRQLGVAIENRRLELRDREMAVSEERNLLAQELHDSIAQSLAFLNIQAQLLQRSLASGELESAREELARIREGIQQSYDTVRELLAYFRIRVGSTDLEVAIRNALEKFEGQTGIRTEMDVLGDAPVPAALSAIQVLHIVQEALSNVRKHASANAVSVQMRRGAELAIEVRDDGRGFDPASLDRDDTTHVGIVIMRERARRIGARLDLDSAVGRGTCVTLVLPAPDATGEAPRDGQADPHPAGG